MAKNTLPKYTQDMYNNEKLERILEVVPNKLKPFRNHPFKVQMDDEMEKLCASIKHYGVLTPLMARPLEDGNYELISGHRRKAAAETLGIKKLPVLVRDMTDDEATILMVDSNIQREHLLPSEKAFAYKMKMVALKHQGARTDLTSGQIGTRSRSDLELAKSSNHSARTIQRYIRLTELAPPLLKMVDQKRIAFSPAIELSYLTKEEQAELWELIRTENCTPSLSQAIRMKKFSQEVKLTPDIIASIMTEEKANQKDYLKISLDSIRKYFPKKFTIDEIESDIMNMLESRYQFRKDLTPINSDSSEEDK